MNVGIGGVGAGGNAAGITVIARYAKPNFVPRGGEAGAGDDAVARELPDEDEDEDEE